MNPLRPAFRTSCRFIPKPRATTETCKRTRAAVRLGCPYGCVKSKPNRIPERSATGGERIPVSERASARIKRIFARACMERRKSIRGEGERASAGHPCSITIQVVSPGEGKQRERQVLKAHSMPARRGEPGDSGEDFGDGGFAGFAI